MENIVYRYAKSKNYAINVGRIGKLEGDFILRDGNMEYAYVQVAMTIMSDRATEERKHRPLEQIRDSYPKFILMRNDLFQRRNSIIHENIPELLVTGRGFTYEE